MKIKIVEEIKNLIPALQVEELKLLEESILKEGVRDPLVVWGDMLVDGHNRYAIAQKHNLEFKTINKEFEDINQVKFWVIENQLGRRNINTYVRGELATAMKDTLIEIGKQKQGARTDLLPILAKGSNSTKQKIDEDLLQNSAKSNPHDTREIIAKKAGVSHDTISKIEKIKKFADEETLEKLRAGKTSINKVHGDIKREEYKKKEHIKKDVSNIIIKDVETRYTLHNCDLLDANVADNSLDAIITDPPYPHKFIDCWKSLAEFGAKKLKEGGVLVAMSGQSYLPEVLGNMNIEGLNYYWVCNIEMTVSPNLRQKRLLTRWKPLLFYVKGKYTRTFLKSDTFKSEYSGTKEGQKHHKWGQSLDLMKDIIETFTYANEIVCDPFAGGNTTIIAGVELKRKMIGIEIDKDVYSKAKKRVEDYFNVAK